MHRIGPALTSLMLLLVLISSDQPVASASTMVTEKPRSTPVTKVKAFPTAKGFGAESVGGRGGRVIEVKNLHDSGRGSLRAAIETTGRRIVVFRTGGMIKLESSLRITSPFITIAGQSAPGGGIALRNDPSLAKPSIQIRTHDVTMRYLRIRPGPSARPSDVLRGLGIGEEAYNVIVDHCSVSWGVDTNLSVWDQAHDVTVQWSIISEGLNDSVHPEGPHSKGFGMGGEGTGSYKISVHHNLFAHNDNRNPQVSNNGPVEVVNNVIYDYGVKAISSSDIDDRVELNLVNNFVKPGPSSDRERYGLELHPESGLGWAVYVSGNISPKRPDLSVPDAEFVAPPDRIYITHDPVISDPIVGVSALAAYEAVLNEAGAILPARDAVDRRIVDQVRSRQGSLIDSPAEVGGWPALRRGRPRRDFDHDGMPNRWEKNNGLNPRNSADGSRAARNGYTNVENYLNRLDGS